MEGKGRALSHPKSNRVNAYFYSANLSDFDRKSIRANTINGEIANVAEMGFCRVIMHWHIILYANWVIADGFMTSYRFYNMAIIPLQIYFRFLVSPRLT